MRPAAVVLAAMAILPAGAAAQPLPPDLPPLGRTRAGPVLPPDAPLGRTRADPVLPQPKPPEPAPGPSGGVTGRVSGDADPPPTAPRVAQPETPREGPATAESTPARPAAGDAGRAPDEPPDETALPPVGATAPVRRDGPPVPDERPAAPSPAAASPSGPAEAPAAAGVGPRELSPAETDTCEEALGDLGVRFTRLDPIAEGECGAVRPLAVEAVGDVALTGPPTLRCPAAFATARWVREVVVPAAALHLDAAVTAVEVSSAYTCRARRNGQETDTLSEHAFANAVDVAAVRLADDRRVAVQPRDDASPERAFQAAIRGGACAIFTTVIGPTTNALHDDHLHLDLAERRGGGKLCE